MVVLTTEIHYCSAVPRNYGGKTREIIIINVAPQLCEVPGCGCRARLLRLLGADPVRPAGLPHCHRQGA